VQMGGNMAESFVVPAAQANLTPIPDDLTGGDGTDAAIEAFGFPQTFEACLR
jgi:hypothetical protein